MLGLGSERAVEGDDVGFGEQLLEPDVVGAQRDALLVLDHVMGEDPATETAQDPHHDGADGTGSDHADRLAVEVEAEQTFE